MLCVTTAITPLHQWGREMKTNTQKYQKNGFKRKMGGPERRFLSLPNANVVMGVRIKGRVSQNLLKSAVLQVRQKHPLLGVRIILDDHSSGWFTQDNVPEIPIDIRPRATNEDWIEVATEELKRAFSTETGPLMRMVLLQSPDVSDLIITAHHSICDGRSLVYLIRDIMNYLEYPDHEREPLPVMPIAIQEYLPSSAAVGWLTKFIIKRMNRKWLRKGISFNTKDYQQLHQEFWQKHHPSIFRWELPPPQTTALVARCRQEQVTVNSALYAAFIKAQQHIQGNSHEYFHNILMPVDFRERLIKPVGEAVGFYVSVVMFKLKITPEKPFWEIARTIDNRARQKLTNKNIFDSQKISLVSPSLMDGIILAKHGKLDDKMAIGHVKRKGLDKLFAGIMVSNLGRLEIPVDYGDLHLDALIGPVAYSDSLQKVLEVVTVGNNMYFTITFGETLISKNTVAQIKDTAMKYLEQALN